MAKKHAGGNVVDPTDGADPRFDPATDGANERAHGEEPKKPKGEDSDVQEIVRRSLERALDHYEENLQPDQKEATDYYWGRPFGDEEEGRSQVVSTDVRDATLQQLPSLLRVFFGPERAVEFEARGPEDEEQARQMTDYVNYIIREDNAGFLTIHSWMKDGLVRRVGWVKWWYDEFYRVKVSEYTGLDVGGLMALQDADGVTDMEVTEVQDGAEILYDVKVTREEKHGCPRFAAIPNEEVVYTPDARSLETAPLVAHVREETAEFLYSLGIDHDLIEDAIGKRRGGREGDLDDARQFHGGGAWRDDEEQDRDASQKKVLFAEAYCLIDGDGDKRGELRKFWCVGPDFTIANGDGEGEIVDEVPLACWSPEPEPHTIVGMGNYDLLKDVQRIKSQILRETLNSLAQAVDPVTEVVEHQVNMQDVLSKEANKVVRVRMPGQIREVGHQFVGPYTLPMMDHFDQIAEQRTGRSKAAQGLDADSLQSATKAAVAATLSASQQRIEMLARIFAETGMKRLMKGLLGLVVKHQNKERVVRLRGKFVSIDPRHWDAGMDVTVNVGLGQGTPEDRISALGGLIGAQKELKAMGAPFVSWVHIRNAMAKAAELAGWPNPDLFMGQWTEQDEARMMEQMAQQPPQPDPNMALVMVEQMKAESHIAVEQQKLALERWKAEREDDREREKLARDAALREHELELKHAVEIEDGKLRAKIEADRMAMDANNRTAEAA